MSPKVRRCVIYARVSVSSEESVSIERQVEAAENYAKARGWDVVGTFTDEGVSATYNRPEKRAGWKAMLAAEETYDAVVIWKVDRLARKVLDFLHADQDLQQRQAGLVCVEDPIDMTTATGRAFATMLAVFGELEAAGISARVAAARKHLHSVGRVPGGKNPFGWKNVKNPSGPGKVRAQDPERIEWVREIVARTQRGETIYSTAKWLNEAGAPRPTKKAQEWYESTVERLLRNPALAGMVTHNPGRTNETKIPKGQGRVVRGEDGLPLVYPDLAVMEVWEWEDMVKQLDARDSVQARPRALKTTTSPLLAGLLYCGDDGPGGKHPGEQPKMWRTTVQGREGYACPTCHQAISKTTREGAANFEDVLVEEFLRQKADHVRWTVVHRVEEGGEDDVKRYASQMRDLDLRIDEAATEDEFERLTAERNEIAKKKRAAAQGDSTRITYRSEPTGWFGTDWRDAEDITEKRAILGDAIERVVVRRAGSGRQSREKILSRLAFDWHDPEHTGPLSE